MLVKLKALASTVYQDLVAPNQKAVVGFVLTALVGYLTRKGYNIPDSVLNTLRSVLEGLVVSAGVWLATNKQTA